MLHKIIEVFKARWFVTLIGAIVLALLIWFVGPLIAVAGARPFDTAVVRFICVLLILVAWGLINIFRLMRAKKSNEDFIDAIATDTDSSAATASAEEIALLNERLLAALGTLKRTRLGGKGARQHLYELPWYILIGPPGSGKTTALVNSGLTFPLADRAVAEAVRGVGGTRNCDWWFTDEAVLLDTAGRYTTQDSHQSVDQASWLGFLGLLKKYRPRQPINGAIIAISVTELITTTESERLSLARAIRQRIRELHDELGIRFPIYVLFTKADLVAGFLEFFDDLGEAERAQVWGTTLPLEESETGVVDYFSKEFDTLVERLIARDIERIHQEPDPQRRARIFAFPSQIASLKSAAVKLLEEIFQPSRYEELPLLRGIYLTSGTQEGTPFDRILSTLSAQFRIERRRLAAFSGRGRSYFLSSLLSNVIFPEASLVGANRKQERRYLWLQRASIATAAALVMALGGLLFVSDQGNRALISKTDSAIAQYEKDTAKIPFARIEDSDLATIFPALNTLRNLPAGYADRAAKVSLPVTMTFGLYQGNKIGAGGIGAYRRALNLAMLPRLLLRLEQQISANLNRPDYLYEALKVYLMLGAQGPMDPGFVHEWMRLDWEQIYPGQENARGRAALLAHLDALASEPVRAIALNGPLVEQARRVLGSMSLADRIYARIRQSSAARQAPVWRIVDHAGPAAARVFIRKSGKTLYDGMPGLYTYDGFYKIFKSELDVVSRELGTDSWVLSGAASDKGLNAAQMQALRHQVTMLYLNDYAAHWDIFLSDISIAPFTNMTSAAEALNILSGPNSPLRNLLIAVTHETELAKPPAPQGAAGVLAKAGDKAKTALTQNATAKRLAAVVGATSNKGDSSPAEFIDRRYAKLREFVLGRQGTPPPMEDVIARLNALYNDLAKSMASLSHEGTIRDFSRGGAGRSVIQQLNSAASRVPPPVNGWLSSAAHTSTAVVVRNARDELNDIWTSRVVPVCRTAIEGRYPFFAHSRADVALGDFKRVFAPNGLIDSFFNTQLKSFVNTSVRPWKWQRVDNVDLGIPQRTLSEFQVAATIRDSFFAEGTAPQVIFEVTPVELDRRATQVQLDIDGQILRYAHGPQRATRMKWPGPNPGLTRIVFSPAIPGRESGMTTEGAWSWFHALSKGRILPGGRSDRFSVQFTVGGRIAVFEIRSNSVINPFNLPALEQFRCPNAL